MIKAYYVISNGVPLFIESDQSKEQVQTLLSGFLSAFHNFAKGLDRSRINKIELDSSTYYYSEHPKVLSIIEAETSDEIEGRFHQIVAERLGREFLNRYSEDLICEWNGDVNLFTDFKDIYSQVISETNKILQKSQKDFISEYFTKAASDENILGTVVFDLENDEIISSDLPKTFSDNDFEAFGSMLFSFIDRLGKTLKLGDINELVLRAKDYWIGGFRKGQIAIFMIFKHDYFGKILPDFVVEYQT